MKTNKELIKERVLELVGDAATPVLVLDSPEYKSVDILIFCGSGVYFEGLPEWEAFYEWLKEDLGFSRMSINSAETVEGACF